MTWVVQWPAVHGPVRPQNASLRLYGGAAFERCLDEFQEAAHVVQFPTGKHTHCMTGGISICVLTLHMCINIELFCHYSLPVMPSCAGCCPSSVSVISSSRATTEHQTKSCCHYSRQRQGGQCSSGKQRAGCSGGSRPHCSGPVSQHSPRAAGPSA